MTLARDFVEVLHDDPFDRSGPPKFLEHLPASEDTLRAADPKTRHTERAAHWAPYTTVVLAAPSIEDDAYSTATECAHCCSKKSLGAVFGKRFKADRLTGLEPLPPLA